MVSLDIDCRGFVKINAIRPDVEDIAADHIGVVAVDDDNAVAPSRLNRAKSSLEIIAS